MPLYLGTWKSQTEYLNDIYNQIKYLPVLLLNRELGNCQFDTINRLITLLHCVGSTVKLKFDELYFCSLH
jgi:hypothetical protein